MHNRSDQDQLHKNLNGPFVEIDLVQTRNTRRVIQHNMWPYKLLANLEEAVRHIDHQRHVVI